MKKRKIDIVMDWQRTKIMATKCLAVDIDWIEYVNENHGTYVIIGKHTDINRLR